ncbi:MAG: hypothetical protein CMJ81_20130 [Planctomycetaceae bacterium]|nr:hypothetical protein [Planctomycetaceae bacterium]MBP62598.1 hypothetical protein [Planctomycetaceae bacterium]
MVPFQTSQPPEQVPELPILQAPDGSQVRLLLEGTRGAMAQFTLAPHQVSLAVAHRTIEEIWFFLSGTGRMWRRLARQEEVVPVSPGVSLTIPTGTHFQFRSDSDEPLVVLGITMPPWPGEQEAYVVQGPWVASD